MLTVTSNLIYSETTKDVKHVRTVTSIVFIVVKTGSTSTNVVAVAVAEQPNHSLPAEKLPTTSTTTTTTTTRSTTTSIAAVYRNVLEVDTPSRPRPSFIDRHPPTVSFDFATRQRPRMQFTSTPPPRRRWPPRRGRYPPTRHRYGRRPSYRSASDRQQVSTFLLAVLAVLVAMDV